MSESPALTETEQEAIEESDFTKWSCFGQIEPDHVECKECPGRVDCAAKAGVVLND